MTWDEIDAVNIAAKAMNLGLAGMTQERWARLSKEERSELADTAGLTQQLIGKEGCRVLVETLEGETERFWVQRSGGWKPVHIKLKRLNSRGGFPAERAYKSVRVLYAVTPY